MSRYQCTTCGQIYEVNDERLKKVSEDTLFRKLWCRKCRENTSQLYIGERKEDQYLYADIIMDARYYIPQNI